MSYLVMQILLCLLIAAIIGFIIGWLFKNFRCSNELEESKLHWQGKLDEANSTWKTKMQGIIGQHNDDLDNANKKIDDLKKLLESKKEESTVLDSELQDTKPVLFTSPKDGKKDNLQLIKGVGKVLEKTLNDVGIYYFKQIASWSQKDIDYIDEKLAFPGRIEREDWVNQAKVLAKGEETEFAKRVKRGDVQTSRDK